VLTRPRPSFLVACLVLAVCLGAAPAVSEGPLTDACRDGGAPQQACDGIRSATHGIADACRATGAPGDACAVLNGQVVADEVVVAYEQSETHRVLGIQRELQADLPLRHAVFVATHNSYNSYAYDPTLSRMDANQTYSISQQLRMDVRRIELDVHWWYGPDGQGAPVTCHATGDPAAYVDTPVTRHTGCTTEDTVDRSLHEIAAWLGDNPGEVIMVRVENHLEGAAGHDVLAAEVERILGDRVYRPEAGGCSELPMDATINDVRAAGRQVIVVGGCGEGSTAWQALSFDDDDLRRESTYRGEPFDYPTCGGIPRTSEDGGVSYDSHWIRQFEDATFLSSATSTGGTAPQRVTPEVAAEWTRCGINQPSFDHLTPTDGRLDALVWSFGVGEDLAPSGDCARVGDDGRLRSAPCTDTHAAFVCRDTTAFSVTTGTGPWHAGHDACAAEGLGTFVTARTGYEAKQVDEARAAAGAAAAWTSLRFVNGTWRTDCAAGGGKVATIRPVSGPPITCG
jgi:hypothetical protein